MNRSRIVGIGSCVPENRDTSEAFEMREGLEPGWVLQRTGVVARPILEEGKAVSDLAIGAASDAIERAGVDPGSVGLLLLATSTPDYPLPPTAPFVAHNAGCTNAGAVDLAGACAGSLYAISLADAHVRATGQHAMVVGANVLSRRTDPRDTATTPIFADGAGAVLLAPQQDQRDRAPAVLATSLGADGSGWRAIHTPAGGSAVPVTQERVAAGKHLIRMEDGPAVFRAAVGSMVQRGEEAMQAGAVAVEELDVWVPHQANIRIIRETGRRLGVPREKTVEIVRDHGNASAASVCIALDVASKDGRVGPGKTVLMTAAGAGFVSAAALVRL